MLKIGKSSLVIILALLLSPAFLFAPASSPAAPLGSQPARARVENRAPERLPSLLLPAARETMDIDFALIAGGRRESREFRNVASEASLVVLIIGVFFVGVAAFAGR